MKKLWAIVTKGCLVQGQALEAGTRVELPCEDVFALIACGRGRAVDPSLLAAAMEEHRAKIVALEGSRNWIARTR